MSWSKSASDICRKKRIEPTTVMAFARDAIGNRTGSEVFMVAGIQFRVSRLPFCCPLIDLVVGETAEFILTK